jgi:hypothetical protein
MLAIHLLGGLSRDEVDLVVAEELRETASSSDQPRDFPRPKLARSHR